MGRRAQLGQHRGPARQDPADQPIEDAQPSDPPGPGSTYTVPPDNLFTAQTTTWHHLFPGGVYDPQLVPGSFEEFGFRWRFDNGLRLRKPHDLECGPDGNLYLIEWGDEFNFAGGGVNPDSGLYRISYVKGGRTPRARAAATPDNAQPPLEVTFSSEGSADPDGEEITYEWNFGDGATSNEPNPTHVYTEAGVYSAHPTVTDTTGRSSSSSVTITVGNTRSAVQFVYPPDGLVFKWGDGIRTR